MQINLKALRADVAQLRKDLAASRGKRDFDHLRKMERWGRACTALGYATAWTCPNPLSAFMLSTGNFARWAVVTHPISHGAYDCIDEAPDRYTTRGFAKGLRRLVDWMDWIVPEAWHEEHNILHHYHVGEVVDPDQLEQNTEWIRNSTMPMAARYAIIAAMSAVWKPVYYAPNTLKELRQTKARRAGDSDASEGNLLKLRTWTPLSAAGRELWFQCWLPYAGWKFVAIPALFTPLGPIAVTNVLINSLFAEVLTNLHGFLVITPNHTGEDIPRFDSKVSGKDEFFLRQIVGSVNYKTGGNLRDFMHGWLNYQIEHHLCPDATLLQMQEMQPRVKAMCEKHGLPYVQDSVFTRMRKTLDIMVGKTTMKRGFDVQAEVPDCEQVA
ncbi:MAG: fatty acid desaturase [Kofleriaceae bacterium]|nr:fatty acid desaturase [Kofleriaceae bacterium]